jgi:pimeloyl-ACP methyl ester carboxylesterase
MIVDLDGVRIGLDDAGTGEPVLLLHGWPDSRDLWRHQVRALAAAGYRVVTPDLRGFGESDKPTDVAAYAMGRMAGDVVDVIDALGIDAVHLVGHDWGAAISWYTATFMPDRVRSLTALSVGHPAAFRSAGLRQREKSWYMLLFQFREVAEEWLGADDFRRFREWSGHPDADAVARRLSDPAALTASLGVYRANVAPATLLAPPLELPKVTVPTMGVWSSGDMALLEEGMTASGSHVAGPWRYERVDGAGHWMQLDAPDAVNALLLDFLRGL